MSWKQTFIGWLARVTMRPEAHRVYSGSTPTGGYSCGLCGLGFENYWSRNYHCWIVHPGCPKNRVESFEDYTYNHCCHCPEDEPCDHCRPLESPYGRTAR